ncbi:MAG: DUF5671 domain-containing protein [Nocardioides sp.]
MVAGLLFLVLVVVLVVLAVRKASARGAGAPTDAHALRRVFQYLLLYGLLVVLALGLSGLLGRLLERDVLVTGDRVGLARDLAFTVVGGPLFVGVALWSRRRFAEDREEARSLGWAFYVTAAALTSLLVAMTGLSQVLRWAVGLEGYDGRAVAQVVVWGGLWGAHWWIDGRVTPREHARVHHLVGSLVGLVTSAVGLAGLLSGGLRVLLGLEGAAVIAGGGSPMLPGLVTLVVGVPVWVVYWARGAASYERDTLWLAYVLLAGVAGGLVTAIVSASTLLYSVLVWLVGQPGTVSAAVHFDSAPTAAAAAVVGAVVWWYHQAVLSADGPGPRTEVRRVYEYLMAGVGLLAAAGGVVVLVAALVEALAGRAFVGGDAVNTLLAAATLLAVGAPVWWLYWRSIQTSAQGVPADELTSATRRVYLFVLFGIGGLAAVVALIVGVYFFFRDVVEGTLGAETLRSMRFPLGVLLTTAAVAGYHWAVYRSDRERAPAAVEAHGPRFVLLVGPPDREIAHEVARRTHGRVQAWSRADDGVGSWSVDEVMAALEGSTATEVMVLSEAEGLRAIPVHRG